MSSYDSQKTSLDTKATREMMVAKLERIEMCDTCRGVI